MAFFPNMENWKLAIRLAACFLRLIFFPKHIFSLSAFPGSHNSLPFFLNLRGVRGSSESRLGYLATQPVWVEAGHCYHHSFEAEYLSLA